LNKSRVKAQSLTLEVHEILFNLSSGEEDGIPGVAVKCVDIGRNTSGEGDLLDGY
jgi:hypothetical protein